MGELLKSSSDGDWTDLEKGFFAAAPPDEAIEPPPALRFDDLDEVSGIPARRARRGPRRVSPKRRNKPAPAVARAWASLVARAGAEARRLSPSLVAAIQATRERVRRGVGVLVSRVATDLPERPDGKTIAAALAALVIVFGVSASVLGSRSAARLPLREPEITLGTPTLSPTEPAPAAALAPEPEAPTPAVVSRAPAASHHHGKKQHAARPSAPHASR